MEGFDEASDPKSNGEVRAMIGEQAVETLGIVAITIMVTSYALEKRARFYIAAFALGCALAAVYAYFLGSYPFLIAETVWAVIAIRRWHAANDAPGSIDGANS